MKLSIIIPIYNVDLYIESCLMSVINQSTDLNYEIILIDDCGKDNSMTIVKNLVEKYAQSHTFNIISHTRNQGLSAARNTGVKYAKGDYIFFLDSDDKLAENSLNLFNEYLDKYEENDFFIGNYETIGGLNNYRLHTSHTIYNNNNEILNAYINNEWYVMACGKFIKRDFFISNNLWFPLRKLHEDLYFSFLLAFTASKMIVIQENIYIYRIHGNSISKSPKRKNFIDIYWTYNKIFNYIQTKRTNVYNPFLISLFFGHTLTVTVSKLKLKEKIVIINWIKKDLKLFSYKNEKFKEKIKLLLLKTPTHNLIYVLKILNYVLQSKG